MRAGEVARVLPDAVRLRAREAGRLEEALAPIVEESVRVSVRKDARSFADALFPVMGPAIRRSIADTFSRMVQSFNQAVENSLSVRGLRWRIEAWRTGKPFGELVLLHSLVYRVEQVYLIHRRTGLLLHHVRAEAVADRDGGMVSGMLTAIQDFVRDSFGAPQDELLDSFRVGELTVWVEQSTNAVLAVVIRGTPPEALKTVLRDALDSVQALLSRELDSFDGDAAPFAPAQPVLEECLRSHYERGGRTRLPAGVWVAAGAVVVALAAWIWYGANDARRVRRALAELDAAPGITVTQARRAGSHLAVTGLRDPLSPDPDSILADNGIRLPRVTARWDTYRSLDAPMVLARARQQLEPPAGVELAYGDGLLAITGRAPHAWLAGVVPLRRFIAGVDSIGLAAFQDIELEEQSARAESTLVLFPLGSSEPLPGQTRAIAALADAAARIIELADATGRPVRFDVIGRTDSSGTEARNALLGNERAATVARRLTRLGLDAARLSPAGVGTTRPLAPETTPAGRARNRSVSVQAVVGSIAK